MDKTNWYQRCQWLMTPLGKMLLAAETLELTRILPKVRVGRFGLVYHPSPLFGLIFQTRVKELLCVTPPLITTEQATPLTVVSEPESLPFLENTMSLVILPHVLEMVADPKQTLQEAVDVLTGQGMLIITGFNPFSFWGLRRLYAADKMPYLGTYISSARIRRYLRSCGCECVKQRTVYYRLPVNNKKWQVRTRFMEVLGRLCWPAFGGAYVIVAQKQQIPLMPIREQWRVKSLLINKSVVEPTPRSRG